MVHGASGRTNGGGYMKPTDFDCFSQVEGVIGTIEALYQLQLCIDEMDEDDINLDGNNVDSTFCWSDTPQGGDFWSDIYFNRVGD